MNVSRRTFVKKLLLFIMVGVLMVSCTAVVFAGSESTDVVEQASEVLEEAEFDEEKVPLSSVPGAVDDSAVVTPFNVISAIGSYSLLIPAVLLAVIALIIAAVFRRKEKAATAK